MPANFDDIMRSATASHFAGRLAEAESSVLTALQLDSTSQPANLLMGVIAGKTNRNELALRHLNQAAETSPNSLEAQFWLSIIYRRLKRLDEAVTCAQRAVDLRPEDAHVYNNLGLCFQEQLKLHDAANAFSKASSIRSDMAPIFHNLGTTLYMLGRDMEAAIAFDRALLLAPKSVDSFLSLGQVMISQTNPDAAMACARKALTLNPNSAIAHLLMASALVENNLTGQAENHLKKAIELAPEEPQAHALLGQRHQSMGRFEEANQHLTKSIELEPSQGFAYFAFVHNNKITEKDRPLVAKMEQLVAEGGLPPRELDFLHYGLGRAFEGLREYKKAMLHFDEANLLARKIKYGEAVFDREAFTRSTDWLIKTFSKEFISAQRPRGLSSQLPIVIVGMMRSGTTLCEQMLSSHPQIGAAGEQRFWPASRAELFGPGGSLFDPNQLPILGENYVTLLNRIASGFGHVTDKNPANYEMLGPIHTALPNARIIHMRRNPVDTCISIYATPNRVPVDFAYDRENIVFAYEEYLRLMEHWRSVLPQDRFIEINYEDVVADRESQMRRILDLVGLKWNDAVLHHEHNERNVNTPSLWQVRQPIYTSSVERWRRYEPWLGAFRRLLPDSSEQP